MTLLPLHRHIRIFKHENGKKDNFVFFLKHKGPKWENKKIKDLRVTNK